MKALAFLVLLAGCPLQTQKSLTLGGGNTGSSSPSTASSAPASSSSSSSSSAGPQDSGEGQRRLDASMLLRHELQALASLSLDAAKAKARSFGHTGEITVKPKWEFVDRCSADPNIVCEATDEYGSGGGMSNSNVLVLWTNKQIEISGPPVE